MSLRFIDSFDHYSTPDIFAGTKWYWGNETGHGGDGLPGIAGNSIGPGIYTSGRTNSCYRIFFNNSESRANMKVMTKFFDNQAQLIIGFAFRFGGSLSQPAVLCSFMDSTSFQVELRLNTSLTLSVTRNGTTLTNGTSVSPIVTNTWYYIEFSSKFLPSISLGDCQVNVNGSNWINVAAGQSTRNTSNSTANTVTLGSRSYNTSSGNSYFDYDDLYICDGTGSAPANTFLGDCRVEARLPSSVGSLSNWIASSSNASVPCISDSAPNSDYNFIFSSTANDISTFLTPALSNTPVTIFGMQLSHFSRKTDPSLRQIADLVRISSTNYSGTTVSLSNTYSYFTTIYQNNPATSTPWTLSTVNSAEIGIKEIT